MLKIPKSAANQMVASALLAAPEQVTAKRLDDAAGISTSKAYRLFNGEAGAELSFGEYLNLCRNLPEVRDELLDIVAQNCGAAIAFIEPVDRDAADINRDGRIDTRDMLLAAVREAGDAQQQLADLAVAAADDRIVTSEEHTALLKPINRLGRLTRLVSAIQHYMTPRVAAH